MENPSSAEQARERAATAVRGQIDRIVKMAKTMRMEPDLSPVWDGDEFKGLPADAQREFAAWATKEGYAAPDLETQPKERKPDAEPDPREVGVRGQVERIVKMAKSMHLDPDLSPVWDGPDFAALPAELQAAVREWATRQGYESAAAPHAEEPESEPASEQPPATLAEAPAPERKERKEHEPKRRQFVRYRVERGDDGGFVLHEDYQEWDRRAGEYRDKSVPTSIAFTGELAKRMDDDPEVMQTVAGFSGQVREELDRSTVKIYFDRPKGDPEKVFPKWKYALEGKTVEEPIKPAEIPADIMALVKGDAQYFKTDAWKKWFGRQMQKKREDVIATELAKLFPDAVPAPAPEKRGALRPQPAPVERAPEKEQEEVAVITPELAAGIDMYVDKLSPKFTLPAQTADLVEMITDFSRNLFEYQLMQGKAGKKPALPLATLKAAVRDALLVKFAGDAAVAGEIRRLVPEARKEAEPLAEPKDGDDEVIEVQDEWIESESDAEKREDPIDAAYASLRDDFDKALPFETVDGYVTKLKALKAAGVTNVSVAADRLLNDISFGKAGEASEGNAGDTPRSDDERKFFDEHPLLDRRNVQRLPDGRIIVHVDRLHPDAALNRAFGRAVEDALERHGMSGDPDLLAKIAEHLKGIVSGKNSSRTVTEPFTKHLASYDARGEELIIKNIDKLGGVIANLAREIIAKRR